MSIILFGKAKKLFEILDVLDKDKKHYLDGVVAGLDEKVRCEGCNRIVNSTESKEDSPHYCETCHYLTGIYGSIEKWDDKTFEEIKRMYGDNF